MAIFALFTAATVATTGVESAGLNVADFGLNVADFGAIGDGHADDTTSLQRAIDESLKKRRRLIFPAGVYVVTRTLVVDGKRFRAAGESKHSVSVVLRANTTLFALLLFNSSYPTPSDPKGKSTEQHLITEITFDAANKANYSLHAAALTRSTFRSVGFNGGRHAGFYFGFGWLNNIEDSSFKYNGRAGLHMFHAANSINVLGSIFEANAGAGILINEGRAVLLQGNTLETNGGPAVVANGIGGLSIKANYFEDNNKEAKALSFANLSGTPLSLCAHVVLNSIPTPTFEERLPAVTLGEPADRGYPWGTAAVTVTGNFHSADQGRPACAAYSAISAYGVRGLVVEANLGRYCTLKQQCTILATHAMNASDVRVALNDLDHGWAAASER